MAQVFACIVTSSSTDRGAYAVTVDTDESVYIGHKASDTLELEEFETIEAIVVKNDRPDIPWRAIRVRRPEDKDGDGD